MYRRYYSYSDMPQMVKKEEPKVVCEEKPQKCIEKEQPNNKLFGKFETDDIILGIVILALLLDDGDDSVLLIALAVIFLSGFN